MAAAMAGAVVAAGRVVAAGCDAGGAACAPIAKRKTTDKPKFVRATLDSKDMFVTDILTSHFALPVWPA